MLFIEWFLYYIIIVSLSDETCIFAVFSDSRPIYLLLIACMLDVKVINGRILYSTINLHLCVVPHYTLEREQMGRICVEALYTCSVAKNQCLLGVNCFLQLRTKLVWEYLPKSITDYPDVLVHEVLYFKQFFRCPNRVAISRNACSTSAVCFQLLLRQCSDVTGCGSG